MGALTPPKEAYMATTKYCSGCNQTKPLNEFYKSRSTSDGYTYRCGECMKEYARQRRRDSSFTQWKAAKRYKP